MFGERSQPRCTRQLLRRSSAAPTQQSVSQLPRHDFVFGRHRYIALYSSYTKTRISTKVICREHIQTKLNSH
ncbi:hypothetical protein EMIT043CA1_230107 [Pseudomonas brassicacearum]